MENISFYRTSKTYWSSLTSKQKENIAIEKLTFEDSDLETCPDCGSNEIIEREGFLGETFWVCSKCGKVVATDFDYSEID